MKHYLNLLLLSLILLGIPLTGLCADETVMNAFRLMEQGKTDKAIEIFEAMASEGEDRAMVQLGILYYEGNGVNQDYDRAIDWFLKAHAKQNTDAFVNLGMMHHKGFGVPENKKIAYCVFLTTHMCGLGSQSTQGRSNRYLRRSLGELSKEDIKDCLSNYTLSYITAYLEAKGQMDGIPDEYMPSKKNPALRDLNWWFDGELDALYGPPSEEETRAREERKRQRDLEREAMRHNLVFQIRFFKDVAGHYLSYDFVNDRGMSSGPISPEKLQERDTHLVFENNELIYTDQHRFVSIKNDKNQALVFKIDHPVKATPCDWSKWQKADYVLKNYMDTYSLLSGQVPESKTASFPDDAPEMRYKVLKE